MAATVHVAAAVVRPRAGPMLPRQMTPAPRNPTPVATPASTCPPVPGKTSTASDAKPAEPAATSAIVRSPAGDPRSSRSMPIVKPSAAASAMRPKIASCSAGSCTREAPAARNR